MDITNKTALIFCDWKMKSGSGAREVMKIACERDVVPDAINRAIRKSQIGIVELVFAAACFLFVVTMTAAAGEAPRLLGRLEGSGGKVAAFSTDGLRLLTASTKTARVWDVQSLQPLFAPIINGGLIRSAVWIAGDTRLATIGTNRVCIWDAKNGELIARIAQGQDVGPAAVSSDGRWAVTANGVAGAALWDISDPKRARLLEEPNPLYWAKFSGDGTMLATYTLRNPKFPQLGGFLHLRDVKTTHDLIPPQDITYFNGGSCVAAISPDSKQLVIAGGKNFTVYQIEGFRKISEKPGDVAEALDSGWTQMVLFTPDGARVIWVCDLGVETFYTRNAAPVGKRTEAIVAKPQEIDVSHGQAFLLTAGMGGDAGIWDVVTGKQVQSFGDKTKSCAISRDGRLASLGCGPLADFETEGYTEIWKLDPTSLPKARD